MYVYHIFDEGSKAARDVAAKTLDEVKAAMKINYFEDKELIAAHVKRFQG